MKQRGPRFVNKICTPIARATVTYSNVLHFLTGLDIDGRHRVAHPEITRVRLLSELLALEAVTYQEGQESKAALGLKLLLSTWGEAESQMQLDALRREQGKLGYVFVNDSQISRFSAFLPQPTA